MGADAVAYGAKYFGALNGTGIIVGKSEIIEAAKLHSFIGFEFGKMRTIGRSMKMDKEDVVAVYVALKTWLTMNHEERIEKDEQKAIKFQNAIKSINKIRVSEPEISGTTIGIKIEFDQKLDANEIVKKLANGNPSIWARELNSHSLIFRMGTISKNDINIIAEKLKEIIK